MNNKSRIPIQLLGQSGCKLQFPNCTVYLDPYLSNSVQDLLHEEWPQRIEEADFIVITWALLRLNE